MPLLLAIEPDVHQQAVLKRIVREHGRADLLLVDSPDAAVAALASDTPDVILVSALLAPKDEEDLIERVRSLDNGSHIHTYTIPQFASTPKDDGRPARNGRFLEKFRRKRVSAPVTGCHPDLFAQEIVTFLARAEELKSQNEGSTFRSLRMTPREPQADAAPPADVAPPVESTSADPSSWASPFEWRPTGQTRNARTDMSAMTDDESSTTPSSAPAASAADMAADEAAHVALRLAEAVGPAPDAGRIADSRPAAGQVSLAIPSGSSDADGEAAERKRRDVEALAAAERAREVAEKQREAEAEREQLEAERKKRGRRKPNGRSRPPRPSRGDATRKPSVSAWKQNRGNWRRRRNGNAGKRKPKGGAASRKPNNDGSKPKRRPKRGVWRQRRSAGEEAAERRAREEDERARNEAERARQEAEAAERANRAAEAAALQKAENERRERIQIAEATARQRREAKARKAAAARRKRPVEAVPAPPPAPAPAVVAEPPVASPASAPDQFAAFREGNDDASGVLRLMPLAPWARSEVRPTRESQTAVPRNNLEELIARLSIPPQIAVIAYPRGCRIRRVRVRAPAAPQPLRSAQPVIVSARALREAR